MLKHVPHTFDKKKKITQYALKCPFLIFTLNILTWGGKKETRNSSGQMPPRGRRAGIQCRLRVDQTCRVLVGQMKGWGEGELSLWAQEQFLQPNWHQFPPSPAGPASVPCSTEPPTGTTYTQKTWRHCSSSVVKKQKDVFVMLAPLLLDLWGTVHKIMAPELKGRVLDQLNEGDEQTPWVRPVHNQPLQQDPAWHNLARVITLN